MNVFGALLMKRVVLAALVLVMLTPSAGKPLENHIRPVSSKALSDPQDSPNNVAVTLFCESASARRPRRLARHCRTRTKRERGVAYVHLGEKKKIRYSAQHRQHHSV